MHANIVFLAGFGNQWIPCLGLPRNDEMCNFSGACLRRIWPVRGDIVMVPWVGLEPTRLAATDFESVMYTNFITRAAEKAGENYGTLQV